MRTVTRTFSGHFISPPFLVGELFHGLSPSARESLIRIGTRRSFGKNETVFAAGDLTNCAYILKSGEAQVTAVNGINEEKTHRMLKTGEIVGLNEMIGNMFCQTSVEAVTPCVFEQLGRSEFLRVLNDQPDLCFRLLTCLGCHIQRSSEAFMSCIF